jgi:hypothetical protein
MDNHRYIISIVLSALLFLALPCASAYGVNPADKRILYQPCSNISMTLSILNNNAEELNLTIGVPEKDKDLIEAGPENIIVTGADYRVQFSITAHMPPEMEPGIRRADLFITPVVNEGDGISAFVSYQIPIYIYNICPGDNPEGYIYYADSDNDGYGSETEKKACSLPVGYSAKSRDCDDNNAVIHPSAAEECNLFDDDCNGMIDDGLLNCNPNSANPNDGTGTTNDTDMINETAVVNDTVVISENDTIVINETSDNNTPEDNITITNTENDIDDNADNNADLNLTELINETQPANETGTVGNGNNSDTDTTEIIVDSTVEITSENALPAAETITPKRNSRGGGGGGGGSGSHATAENAWICTEWSACIDDFQEQLCTSRQDSKLTKKNKRNCELTALKEPETQPMETTDTKPGEIILSEPTFLSPSAEEQSGLPDPTVADVPDTLLAAGTGIEASSLKSNQQKPVNLTMQISEWIKDILFRISSLIA